MAIAIVPNAPKIVTLATTKQVLQVGGNPAIGDLLEIAWVAQTATNVVYVEFGGSLVDGAAVATDRLPVWPGSSYREYVPFTGQGGVSVAGVGAFDVSLRVIRL